MIEGIFIGVFVASICATGAMFLKLIESKKEVTEQKKMTDDLLTENAELKKQLDQAQLQNAKFSAQPPKAAAISVRMSRPDRGFGGL